MKNETKHIARRCCLIVIPLLISGVISIAVCRMMVYRDMLIDTTNMIDVSKVMISVWGTLLGFIITAESILVAFSNGTITQEFKKTRHYTTVIFQYTQTSIKLLVYILIFIFIIVVNKFDSLDMFLFIFFSLLTFIDIFVCLIILVLMLKMANK